jgi:co-chaperonin GroES (HSP10)
MSPPKVYLGDLSTLTIEGNRLSGYGLYSDNVYLRGSLTTFYQEGESKSSAGVNTNSEARTESKEKIVFWAGAPGTDKESIEQALFKVTEEGSIYAEKGIFNGSVISNSEIETSIIRTANIYGTGEGDAALTFYDTEKGISFKN